MTVASNCSSIALLQISYHQPSNMEDLAEKLFGKKASEELWQDREVRFDSVAQFLQCRKGEEVLATYVGVTRQAAGSDRSMMHVLPVFSCPIFLGAAGSRGGHQGKQWR